MNPTTCGPPCRRIHVMGPLPPRRARLKPRMSVTVRSTPLDTAKMLGEVLDTLDALKTVVITQAMSQREFPMSNTEPERTHLDMSGWEYGPRGWQRKPGRTNWAGLEDALRERTAAVPTTEEEWQRRGWKAVPGGHVPDPEHPRINPPYDGTLKVNRDYATDPQYKPKPYNRFPDEMDQISWADEGEVSEVAPEPLEAPVSRWTCGGRDVYLSEPAARQIAAQGQPEGTQPYVEECADCGGWHTEPRAFPVAKERLCQKARYATAQIAEAVKRVYEEVEPKCETCGGFHLRNTRANP